MSNEGTSESSIKFPLKPPGQAKVWNVVECVKKGRQGPPVKFSIQEIPEDRYEDVLDHMCKYFIAEEPICKFLNAKDDPNYVSNFRQIWKEMLNQGLSVAAFTANPRGGKPLLAGANVLELNRKGHKYDFSHLETEKEKRVTRILIETQREAKVHEKYGVDKYLSAMGLSVNPLFQGASLGTHLLKARENICREYNISVTATLFTSAISQMLAARCGFEELMVKDYDSFVDEEGNKIFPGIETKVMKVMAKKFF
ncbi:arylalkylamine N-acetyltransferase-like 2 [Ptiloglossa arizonensis]|uniref:arylalkylamine N-acetyltransferase-like 2 n=1 Tax=Ptiloglossa arizonensis TaxID=3350558 RepID=UPI003FA0468B